MTNQKETKKIKCYWCNKTTGIAYKILREEETGKGKKKKIIKTWIWEAKGFRLRNSSNWICEKCSKNKCEKCQILLSNIKVCRCGIKHGAFYSKHPTYCKDCWDKISQNKNAKKRNK